MKSVLYLNMVTQGRSRRAEDTERIYEGWNFNSGNYLFTTDTK